MFVAKSDKQITKEMFRAPKYIYDDTVPEHVKKRLDRIGICFVAKKQMSNHEEVPIKVSFAENAVFLFPKEILIGTMTRYLFSCMQVGDYVYIIDNDLEINILLGNPVCKFVYKVTKKKGLMRHVHHRVLYGFKRSCAEESKFNGYWL